MFEGIYWWKDGKLEPESNDEPIGPIYNDFIIDDEFRQFLIDHNCYHEYLVNTTNRYSDEQILNFVLKKNKYDYIDRSFVWSRTPEGDEFWGRMDNKWKKYCGYYEYDYDDDN